MNNSFRFAYAGNESSDEVIDKNTPILCNCCTLRFLIDGINKVKGV